MKLFCEDDHSPFARSRGLAADDHTEVCESNVTNHRIDKERRPLQQTRREARPIEQPFLG